MSLKPQLEAIIYAAETPISLDQILSLVKESLLAEAPGIDAAEMKSRIRATLEELIADYSGADHGIEIRQARSARRGARFREEPETAIPAFASGARNSCRYRLQTAGHRARDQRNPWRRCRRSRSRATCFPVRALWWKRLQLRAHH